MELEDSKIKKTVIIVLFLIAFHFIVVAQVHDIVTPLPENSIRLKDNLSGIRLFSGTKEKEWFLMLNLYKYLEQEGPDS